MRIAICDRSAEDIETLSSMIEDYFLPGEKPIHIIGCLGTQKLEEEISFSKFEYVFLDESIGDLDKIATVFLRTNRVKHLILTGETREGAAAGYNIGAKSFVIKPYIESDVRLVFNEAKDNMYGYIIVNTRYGYHQVSYNDITYIETCPNGCIIHTLDKYSHRVYMTLSRMQDILGEQFIRCNNFYLVSLRYIDRMEKDIILTTGEVIQVSRRRAAITRKIIMESKKIELEKMLY